MLSIQQIALEPCYPECRALWKPEERLKMEQVRLLPHFATRTMATKIDFRSIYMCVGWGELSGGRR
jgi:hypothetical protein